MITRITKANADKYRVLFADAIKDLRTHDVNGFAEGQPEYSGVPVIQNTVTYQEMYVREDEFVPGEHYIKTGEGKYTITALDAIYDPEATYAIAHGPEDSITSIEDYFGYIEQLLAIDRKYTVLPLEDEENFFKIDANSRMIEVPKSFKDNGVAVQGDEIAEVLYFQIDRFFDMDDLGEKSIYIQWKAPADPNDKSAPRKEGVSIPWVIDKTIKPGYVVIGWPLASEITEFPGKLDFSVRFYTIGEEDGKLKYSLSTTTATVDIREGLNYDLEKLETDTSGAVVDSASLIMNRVVNTEKDDPNAPIPLNPEFIDEIILSDAGGYEESVDENGKKIYEVYLTNPNTGEEKNATYRVQAITTDAGLLSYTWFRKDEVGEVVSSGPVSTGYAYVKTDDEVYNPNKVYYIQEAINSYKPFDVTAGDFASNKAKLYERFNEAVITKDGANVLGTYQVRANNRVGRRIAKTFGTTVHISGPEAPQIVEPLPAQVTFNGNNKYRLNVNTETDSHAYTQYEYIWESLVSEATNTAVSTNNYYDIVAVPYDEDYDSNKDYGDGYYQVVVKSKLNGDIQTVTSDKVRVTHEATPVKITKDTTHATEGDDYSISNPLKIFIEFNKIEEKRRIPDEDYVTYQWYRYNSNASFEQLKADISNAEKGQYAVGELDIPIPGATQDTVTLINTANNESGSYFCEVTNHYNGSIATSCSSFFTVIDTPIDA